MAIPSFFKKFAEKKKDDKPKSKFTVSSFVKKTEDNKKQEKPSFSKKFGCK